MGWSSTSAGCAPPQGHRNRTVVLAGSVPGVPARPNLEPAEGVAWWAPCLRDALHDSAARPTRELLPELQQLIRRPFGDAPHRAVRLVRHPAVEPETDRGVADEHPEADPLDSAMDRRVELLA